MCIGNRPGSDQRRRSQSRSPIRTFHVQPKHLRGSYFVCWQKFQISKKLESESYTPRTWRTHPLHLCPPEPFKPSDPRTTACLDWIFLISSLNFSFWSEREGHADRFGVDWREGWGMEKRTVHTGYWSLVAAIDRGTCTYPFFFLMQADTENAC